MTRGNRAPLVYGSVVCAGMALLLSSSALAETATGTLDVSAQVEAVCSVADASLIFDPYNADSDAEGETRLVVRCTSPYSVTVTLNDGSDPDNGQRRMSNGTDHLEYDLYTDENRQTRFETVGDITGNPGGTEVPVYGLIPAGQPVPIGNYSDTVGISIVF